MLDWEVWCDNNNVICLINKQQCWDILFRLCLINAFSQIIIQNVPLVICFQDYFSTTGGGLRPIQIRGQLHLIDPIYTVVTSITTPIHTSNVSLEIVTLSLPKNNNISNQKYHYR